MTRKYKIDVEFKGCDNTLSIIDVIEHQITMGYLDVLAGNKDRIIEYHIDLSGIKYWAIYRRMGA